MNIQAQLYHTETNQRSPAVTCDRRKLANSLKQMREVDQIKFDETVVIILLEQLPGSEEWQHTTAPLMRALDFMEIFGDKDHG